MTVIVLWPDETKIECFTLPNMSMVYMAKWNAYKENHLIPTVKYGGVNDV